MLETKIKTDPKKSFLSNVFNFIEYIMSFRILIVIVLLSLLSEIVLFSSTLTFYVSIIIFVVSMKFAVEILNTTAHGRFQPDDVANTNQDASIILKMVGVGFIYFMVLNFASQSSNPKIALLIMYGGLFFMPAIYMVLSVTESMSQSLNPITIFKFIQPWAFNYILFFGFYLLSNFIQRNGIDVLAVSYLPSWVSYFVSNFFELFFLFLNFQIMGFLIYQNRDAFGLDSEVEYDKSVQIEDVAISGIESISVNPIHRRVKSLLDKGEITEALAIIKEIQSNGDNSSSLKALSKRAEELNENQKHIPDSLKIHQFIVKKEFGNAFNLYKEMHHKQEIYIEESATDLTSLANYANNTQQYSLALRLLSDFSKKYPSHDDVVPNYFLIVQILYQNPQSQNKAKMILDKLIAKFPNHKMNTELKSWKKGIELVKRKSDY